MNIIPGAHVLWSMTTLDGEMLRWKAIILSWIFIKALVFGKSRLFIAKWVAYVVDNIWVLPPVFVRLVLLASVGVSRGLLRESGGSDSMCGCWLWWCGLEKIPFCCTAPPAIIFYKEALGSVLFSLHAICKYVVSKCETTIIWMFGVRRSSVAA